MADGYVAQRLARQSLETITSVAPPEPPFISAGTTIQTAPPIIGRGAAIAALSIPRVELSAVVLHGSDEQTLRRGPGHLEGTAMPGHVGNVVIAGHRDSFFRPLRKIRLGDDLFLDTPHGRLQYRVTWLRVVQPRDLSVIAPTDEEVLTLITCYPFWLLGNAPDRFVVRATRVGGAPAMAVAQLASATPPLESIADPYVEPAVATRDRSVAKRSALLDNETQIRQAIERFRVTYNARLISRNDHRPGGLLEFRTCDVMIDGDEAVAHCGTTTESAERHIWTSSLQRTGGVWTIKQIVSAD
jgi:LPXTG-site transpeptidase (sortase) family protein